MEETIFERYREREEHTAILAQDAMDVEVALDEEEENHDPSQISWRNLQRLFSVVLPHKRRSGRVFTRAQEEHNRRLAHHRVVCEQFYGRLKVKMAYSFHEVSQ
jgi:hypothetical protein